MSTSSPTSARGIKGVNWGGDTQLTAGLNAGLAISNVLNGKIQYLCERGCIVDRERDINDVGQCSRQQCLA